MFRVWKANRIFNIPSAYKNSSLITSTTYAVISSLAFLLVVLTGDELSLSTLHGPHSSESPSVLLPNHIPGPSLGLLNLRSWDGTQESKF